MSGASGMQRGGLIVVNTNRLVEACQLKDAAVVLTQPIGKQSLLLTVDANEQGDEQSNAATVHILEAAEVEDKDARGGRVGLGIGVHQDVLGEGGHVALDVNNTDGGRDPSDGHLYVGLWHRFPSYVFLSSMSPLSSSACCDMLCVATFPLRRRLAQRAPLRRQRYDA